MIIVTGGAGFIGSNFIQNWIAHKNEPVLNLDKLTYAANPENLQSLNTNTRYLFAQGDICDRELVSSLLKTHRPRAIINFAAETHVDRSITGPSDFIQTNLVGTFNLLECTKVYLSQLNEADRSAFRFFHISTDEVYGSLNMEDAPFTEEHPYKPNSPYSASKAGSDHLVRSYHHTFKIPTLITNCSNNYGPAQHFEKLIPLMIRHALHEKSLPVYGNGMNVRDWLYVEDHCLAIMAVLEKGRIGETYNIGGNCEKNNIDVVTTICERLDQLKPRTNGKSYKDLITFVQDRPGHDFRYAINTSKIEKELGWKPRENFESGITRTIHWYLEKISRS